MATIADFYREWDSELPYVTAHTSGSTGQPKEIRLLKSDMRVSAEATNTFFGIGRESIVALPLSPDYIAGKMMAVRARMAGCRLIELPVSNHISLNCRVDLLAVVPSQIESLLADGAIRQVRNLLVGGAPLDDRLSTRLMESGAKAFVGYGMTETCSHVALREVGCDVYSAMRGITFGLDSRGCLMVRSARFSWHELATNDVVELCDDRHFRWLGRADNVINSGGIKIHPEALEAEIRSRFPGIAPFYITREPDPRWGEVPVMVTEPGDCPTPEAIKATLRDPRHAPSRMITVAHLPVTPGGNKLRRLPPGQLCAD